MSTERVAIYNTSSGKIDRIVTCIAPQVKSQAQDGEAYIYVEESVSDSTYYVDTESLEAVPRNPFDPRYSIDGLAVRFDGLPPSAVIRVMGQQLIADGDDEIEFDVPGTYRIGLHHPHFLDKTLEVTVG